MSRITTLRLLVRRLPVDPDLPARSARSMREPVAVSLVAIGGGAGALCRAGVSASVPAGTSGWPSATLTVNTVGAGLLALLLVVLAERFPLVPGVRPLLGTGLLGGFTTFSTFSTETVRLSRAGHPLLAGGYVAASVTGALAAAGLGLLVGRIAVRLVDRPTWLRRARHAGLLEAAEASGGGSRR